MCMPGAAPVRANSDKMFADARAAGERIVAMVNENLTPRKVMTEGAFRNAAHKQEGVLSPDLLGTAGLRAARPTPASHRNPMPR